MKLSKYISMKRGRGAAVARKIGVSPQQIYQWANGTRPTPKEHGAALEAACDGNVTRQELFPDDWERFWPELAQQSKKQNRAHDTAEQVRETGGVRQQAKPEKVIL